ncbi:MAG: DUF3108 domain-containing protein [Parcubacteria group bacterium]|nr:DUF3108 domain-containing protein [Parcubacteria group bacterium]
MKTVLINLTVSLFFLVNALPLFSQNEAYTHNQKKYSHEYIRFAIWWGQPVKYLFPEKLVKLGSGILRSDIILKNGYELMRVEASAAPSQFFRSLYDADVSYESFMNPRTLQMISMNYSLHEKNILRTITANFDTLQWTVVGKDIAYENKIIKKEKEKTASFDSTRILTDGIGAFYRFRLLSFNPKDTVAFEVFDPSVGLDTLKTIILYKETIETIFGKNTPCVVIVPIVDGYAVTSLQRDRFLLWVTNDDRKIIVQIQTAVAIGKITFRLEEYKKW